MYKIIFIIFLITTVASQTFCSAYCLTCNGTTSTSCLTCPTNFTSNGSNGCNPPVAYNMVYEQAIANNFTLNVTCGSYLVVGSTQASNITILNSFAMTGHYKIRVRVFIIWLTVFTVTSDAIHIYIDGTSNKSSAYSANTTTNASCNSINQKGYSLDTG